MSSTRNLVERALELDRLYLAADRALRGCERTTNRKAQEAFRREAASASAAYARLSESPLPGDLRCVNCGKWTEADQGDCRSCRLPPTEAVFLGAGI